MRIDLHAHSNVSDGTDTPADLVAKAYAAGLDVLALTDHDTTRGWDEAEDAAAIWGIRLIRGIELSTSHLTGGQHLLAYEPDRAHRGLDLILARGQQSRDGRVAQIVARLAVLDMHITVEDVARHAAGGTSGRPHIADALVEAGYVVDRDEAFVKYLRRGMPASVMRWQEGTADAVMSVVHAGGVPVLAHPWGRGQDMTEADFAYLAERGLAGIEVDHQEHDAAARAALRSIAANLGLIVTGSSDHHGTGKVNHDLGCNTTAPDEFEALDDLIATRRAEYTAKRQAEQEAQDRAERAEAVRAYARLRPADG